MQMEIKEGASWLSEFDWCIRLAKEPGSECGGRGRRAKLEQWSGGRTHQSTKDTQAADVRSRRIRTASCSRLSSPTSRQLAPNLRKNLNLHRMEFVRPLSTARQSWSS